MLTVIDYKAGNLTSVVKALRHLGAKVTVTDSPVALDGATRIVLPGVGHFAATARLDQSGLTPAIRSAIARGVPFLGICVGMQWLFAGSTEAPDQPGLGFFPQTVTRFPSDANSHAEKVPHVGWNQLEITRSAALLAGVGFGDFAYFTHSWRAPVTEDTVAVTRYIQPFAAAVQRGNVCGVQFHPEKSADAGLAILRNFLEIAPC
uniref:Putative Imidazole glycerol phosphate synthase subunit hisH (IGP synthase glutamine amidotransferase subunit) (IGP synthase subunit hisH) (ImGP synthase subunit hisH) (IGPS subunit hisH) n=1 Tax=mine drainage metagenome TaxID=410659 RepID=E6PX83_9ZZZZ